jgi:hypothetical protein
MRRRDRIRSVLDSLLALQRDEAVFQASTLADVDKQLAAAESAVADLQRQVLG